TSAPPSITVTPSATTICAGAPVTFTAAATNTGTAPVYQWQKNGVNVGANALTYTDNTITSGDIINCLVTSDSACTIPDTHRSNDVSITVNTAQIPAISITTSANNICAGTPVTFTASATNPSATPTYQWKKNGIAIGSNNNTYTDNALNNSDIITCELTSSYAC